VALVSSFAATVGVAVAMGRADRATGSDAGTVAVGPVVSTAVPTTTTRTSTTPIPTVPIPTPPTTPTTATSPRVTDPSTGFADGVYFGPNGKTRWGDVQVRVTITNGHITSVKVARAPNDNSHSAALSADAGPKLESEAIAAQAADIDAVSGATFTSEAYKTSLQGALDLASQTG
jgi:uncharacterized protein with FMN-binding domain